MTNFITLEDIITLFVYENSVIAATDILIEVICAARNSLEQQATLA